MECRRLCGSTGPWEGASPEDSVLCQTRENELQLGQTIFFFYIKVSFSLFFSLSFYLSLWVFLIFINLHSHPPPPFCGVVQRSMHIRESQRRASIWEPPSLRKMVSSSWTHAGVLWTLQQDPWDVTPNYLGHLDILMSMAPFTTTTTITDKQTHTHTQEATHRGTSRWQSPGI